MKIVLAGFNVEHEPLKTLSKKHKLEFPLTPEVLSAGYARISRSAKTVTELRREARNRIEKARKSNRKIIFEMGHHSVAEHAVFNFDIIDVSRLLTEKIEKFRLNSYTEKSQRYIKLEGNYVIPEEIARTKHLTRFNQVTRAGIQFYHKLYSTIIEHEKKKLGREPTKKENKEIGLKANEDARYILNLAQKTQIGETINARNIELLLRRFASSNLSEARVFGKKMFELIKEIAPSIILFYKENKFDKNTYTNLRDFFSKINTVDNSKKAKKDVALIKWTKDADSMLAAALLHTSSNISFTDAKKRLNSMDKKMMKELIKKSFKHMELYDTVLREFEHIDLTFELIVSASCFAQLKRHRQATITHQNYNPELGVTIPPSFYDIGVVEEFMSRIEEVNNLYYKIKEESPEGAQYILTNAHRKRVLLSLNTRELYHVSRLREDKHAQWEIREKTKKMVNLAKKVMPFTLMLTGGKDIYPSVYKDIFGEYPYVISPVLPT
jgi:flavin-dependent thymidylate synthase